MTRDGEKGGSGDGATEKERKGDGGKRGRGEAALSLPVAPSPRRPVTPSPRRPVTPSLHYWFDFDGGSNSSPAAIVLSVCDSFIVNINGLYSKAFGPPREFWTSITR